MLSVIEIIILNTPKSSVESIDIVIRKSFQTILMLSPHGLRKFAPSNLYGFICLNKNLFKQT